MHNTSSADKDLKKYILSEEEWEYISEIRDILQVNQLFLMIVYIYYVHILSIYISLIESFLLYSIIKNAQI